MRAYGWTLLGYEKLSCRTSLERAGGARSRESGASVKCRLPAVRRVRDTRLMKSHAKSQGRKDLDERLLPANLGLRRLKREAVFHKATSVPLVLLRIFMKGNPIALRLKDRAEPGDGSQGPE